MPSGVKGGEVPLDHKDRVALLPNGEQEGREVEVTDYLGGDCVGAVQVEPGAMCPPDTEPVTVAVADEPIVYIKPSYAVSWVMSVSLFSWLSILSRLFPCMSRALLIT